MSAQPITTDEQTTDPQVRDRLIAACDSDAVMPVTTCTGNPWSRGKGLIGPCVDGESRSRYDWSGYGTLRARVIDNARSGFADYCARKGL